MLDSPPNHNPYFNLTAIRKPDMFFGRINLFRHFYAAIANRQSVSLVGLRRIGKTSFLLRASQSEMQERFEFDLSHHIFAYLDLREYLHKNCEDFFEAVSNRLIARCPDLVDVRLPPGCNGEDKYSLLLEEIVDKQFFPVLLLDAFDNITLNKHFNPEFFALLRAEATIGNISYVTATIDPLGEVCHSGIADSPFFNIFYNYSLGPLTLDEARALITRPAMEAGLPFSDDESAWILAIAGRHPFFIQHACHCLFEQKVSADKEQIDLRYVKKLIYTDLHLHFQDTWDRLSELDRMVLQDEAQKESNHPRVLPELSESALFRQFVRHILQTKVFKMTPEELEHALDNLDDAAALGGTNLRLLSLISRRLRKDISPTVVEKGMVIRSILKEAFERLGDPAARSDSDPIWRNYNILYYRYFKYHLKNEQVALRLGISLRRYFSYRKKAIIALLNVLFEMENAADDEGVE
jgi:Novel STAND NTPase 2